MHWWKGTLWEKYGFHWHGQLERLVKCLKVMLVRCISSDVMRCYWVLCSWGRILKRATATFKLVLQLSHFWFKNAILTWQVSDGSNMTFLRMWQNSSKSILYKGINQFFYKSTPKGPREPKRLFVFLGRLLWM
jgi:hypothetical protein